MKISIKVDAKKLRQLEYPPIQDQLEAIWSILATLPAKDFPPETLLIRDKIKATKEKFKEK